MNQLYVTEILIESVRYLNDIRIPLEQNMKKHLVITGKNGSGKTSVLNALAEFLNNITITTRVKDIRCVLESDYKALKSGDINGDFYDEILEQVKNNENNLKLATQGVDIQFNYNIGKIHQMFENGEFVLAYYKADRVFTADIPKHVEKVELKDNYSIAETPRQDFVKYLLDLKMTEALSITGGKKEKAEAIKNWFANFDKLLQSIFDDSSVHLDFDEETFLFRILEDGKEPYDFNTLSSGYAAVLDIVVDIILRMEKRNKKSFQFDMPGIILIDEIETHLHLELQKRVLQLLTTIFPNVQFILSTHSPFILNSKEDMVIYDLEKRLLIEDGLSDIPYSGIVEGYFGADLLSDELKEKFNRYKLLVKRSSITDDNLEEIAKLEMYLDEIPDYLALGITTEYQKMKMEFGNREDI